MFLEAVAYTMVKRMAKRKSMKKNKILMVATTASMIGEFNLENIKILQNLGFEVEVACNFEKGSSWSVAESQKLKGYLEDKGCTCYHIDIARSPTKVIDNYKAYTQLTRIVANDQITLLHCHTPMGGALTRLVAKKFDIPVIYTAHGFHFYKGAPLKNWLLFYPVEKYLSRFTDTLITINSQDYKLATEKMKANIVKKIPGVGVDLNKFKFNENDRKIIRRNLGIRDDEILILSVGELNKNKNHEVILEAINRLDNSQVKYFIAGIGDQKNALLNKANQFGLKDRFKLLGFRNDISELDIAADIFAFPSHREGLGLSALEAMAAKKPIVASNVGGIVDYLSSGRNGYSYDPTDVNGFTKGLGILIKNSGLRKQIGENNYCDVKNFSKDKSNEIMREIYKTYMG